MAQAGSLRKAILFIAVLYALSFAISQLYFTLGGTFRSPLAVPFAIVYMFMPAVSAAIVQKGICREGVAGPLGISFRWNRWYLVAWLIPPVLAALTFGVSLLLPGVRYDPTLSGLIQRIAPMFGQNQPVSPPSLPLSPPAIWLAGLLAGMIAGATVNAVAGFGEELGWRGLLQKELGFLGFWRMSAVIGIVWGLWHAPLILRGYNYPQHPVAGVFMMTAWTMLLSPIFSYVRIRTDSVIGASVLHGTLNGTAGLSLIFVASRNDLLTGVMGLAGFIVLGLMNLALVIYRLRNG